MLPDLNFIKTTLNGILSMEARLLGRISEVDGKIHTPDYTAEEGQDGYIKNKPTLIGRAGTGKRAELFNGAKKASGDYAHAEGDYTTASGYAAHAEGDYTTASGDYAHAEGSNTSASEYCSHAEGSNTSASGYSSHAEGFGTTASGSDSHAEGNNTEANGRYQHVQGRWNIIDDANKYAHIVGNGTSNSARSNAHTLDWDGNAWFAGGVELTSPGGKRYRFTVADDGTLISTEVTA